MRQSHSTASCFLCPLSSPNANPQSAPRLAGVSCGPWQPYQVAGSQSKFGCVASSYGQGPAAAPMPTSWRSAELPPWPHVQLGWELSMLSFDSGGCHSNCHSLPSNVFKDFSFIGAQVEQQAQQQQQQQECSWQPF